MKKIITILLVLFSITISVEAKDSLGFKDDDGSLYYSAESNENIFLTYGEMTSGKMYSDTLKVKNYSPNTYRLYLRINSLKGGFLEEELIEKLVMKIYSDGKLAYDGDAKAMEYDDKGVAIYQLIDLGEFKPDEVKEVVVELKIKDGYIIDPDLEAGQIAWQFFAGYEDGIMPYPPVPNGAISNRTVLASAVALFTSLILVLLYRTKHGMNEKEDKERRESA